MALDEQHRAPRFHDAGVLAFVPDHWSQVWQPRHYVLTELSRYFHVLWLEPAEEWRTVLRDWRGWSRRRTFIPDGNSWPGFRVRNQEPWFPNLYRPSWLRVFIEKQRVQRACAALRQIGCRRIVVYFWRPQFAPAIHLYPWDFSCYHIDDEYSFSNEEVPVGPEEFRLISEVDQVFVHSRALMEKRGKINPQTRLVPNGVNFSAYSRTQPEPADLRSIAHPRIGYTGFLKKHLDWGLIRALVLQHPAWSFVFVGPRSPHLEIDAAVDELAHFSNVHFLGAKTVAELAAYPQHFDACIMPYARTSYTKYIYPMKLHEYLASGRPTIGTRLPALEEFSKIVSLAETEGEWTAALLDALSPEANHPDRVVDRQIVACRFDWGILVSQIAEAMAQRLGPDYFGYFDRSLQEKAMEL